MKFVLDASIHLNALNPLEADSRTSQIFLERLFKKPWPVISPTLLLVEVAAAVARVFHDTHRGLAIAEAIYRLPGQIWIPWMRISRRKLLNWRPSIDCGESIASMRQWPTGIRLFWLPWIGSS